MPSWSYAACDTCRGKGTLQNEVCPTCNGYGYWEFVKDERNDVALDALKGEVSNSVGTDLANGRIAGLTPDNFYQTLIDLSEHFKYGEGDEQIAFEALHNAGADRWGWAWLLTNRFAIELAKLNGYNHTEHRYALSKLVWTWLEREQQEKVEAPS